MIAFSLTRGHRYKKIQLNVCFLFFPPLPFELEKSVGLGQFYGTVCRHGTIPVTNCHEKIFSGIALGAREYAGMGWERYGIALGRIVC